MKILTSKLFDIKILQTLFAEPAPSKAFRGMGAGGYPQFRLPVRQNVPFREGRPNFIFAQKSTALFGMTERRLRCLNLKTEATRTE